MKKIRKFSALLLALAMALSLSLSAAAAENTYMLDGHPGVQVTTGTRQSSANPITPRNRLHLDEPLAGKTFRDGFVCRSGQGVELGIAIRNDGSANVRAYITYDGEDLDVLTIKPGNTGFALVRHTAQLSAAAEVYVESATSAEMSGRVVAYQGNNANDVFDYI